MPTRLRKLKITRVAVCERGANQDADILLFKSAEAPRCDAPDCDDPACPVHGEGEQQDETTKTLNGAAEPEGDACPPMDYATRSTQAELWHCLWDKWSRFCDTVYDVIGDCETDAIPHLPILVDSIGQFQTDVEALLRACGVLTKCAPHLATLVEIAKAGSAMAAHRRTRLCEAITVLQAILDECTPVEVEHAGVSAAEVAGVPGAINGRVPSPDPAVKGEPMEKTGTAPSLEDVLKRAATAEARVTTLEAELATATARAATLEQDAKIAKMSPEEQREQMLASMPELVRKNYLDQEARLAVVEKANRELHERNERLDYMAKAAPYRAVGLVPETHWEVLKHIDAMPEASREELLRLLKAAAAQLQKSVLFAAQGVNGTTAAGSSEGASAEDEFTTLAKAYSTEHKVEMGKAIDAIAHERPELWERIQASRRLTNRVAAAPPA